MRLRSLCPTLFRSSALPLPRPLGRSGQFLPLTAMVIFSGTVLLIAAVNVYRVAKAKLQAQNIADAVAMAVAGMQGRDVNVVVDRDEWLNHLYPDDKPGTDVTKNCARFPPISMVGIKPWDKCKMSKEKAAQYAQLIATINKAQWMFHEAYSRFIGADDRAVTQNSGQGSLAEILSEIDGLNDPA